MRATAERGQATAEYGALLMIVAAVLASAGALTAGGLGDEIVRGLRRGICSVTGSRCPLPAVRRDLAACPLRRGSRGERLAEAIGFVKLSTSGRISAERRSDGTVTVTFADGSGAGVEGGVGARVRVGRGAGGATATAGAGASWTSGRSWEFPDAAAARRFLARYGDKETIGGKLVDEVRSACSLLCDLVGWRPHPRLPEPDARYEDAGGYAEAAAQLELGPVDAHARATAAALLGRRRRSNGETTWYLSLSGAAAAAIGTFAGELGASAEGSAVAEYTVGRDGTPLSIVLDGAGGIAAALHAAPGAQAGDAGSRGLLRSITAAGGLRGGRLLEAQATLPLGDPRDRAAARALVGALLEPRLLATLPAVSGELGRAIARHGVIDLRSYAESGAEGGVEARIGAGLEAGAGWGWERRALRLTAAYTALPGLPLLPRGDCAGAGAPGLV